MIDVLRTRYSAFYFRKIDYIMQTTHPTSGDYSEDKIAWARELDKKGMIDSIDFVELKAGPEEHTSDENEGYIQFSVRLRAKPNRGVPSGKETILSEHSRFLRNEEDGVWSYASGDVRSEEAGLDSLILN